MSTKEAHCNERLFHTIHTFLRFIHVIPPLCRHSPNGMQQCGYRRADNSRVYLYMTEMGEPNRLLLGLRRARLDINTFVDEGSKAHVIVWPTSM